MAGCGIALMLPRGSRSGEPGLVKHVVIGPEFRIPDRGHAALRPTIDAAIYTRSSLRSSWW